MGLCFSIMKKQKKQWPFKVFLERRTQEGMNCLSMHRFAALLNQHKFVFPFPVVFFGRIWA